MGLISVSYSAVSQAVARMEQRRQRDRSRYDQAEEAEANMSYVET